MKISDAKNKIVISKIIDEKRDFFRKNFHNIIGNNIKYDVMDVIPKKTYNKILYTLAPLVALFALWPFFVTIIFVPRSSFSVFFIFIGIILTIFNMVWVIYDLSGIIIKKLCDKWLYKNRNKITVKDALFNNIVVDNDILDKIKSIYGKDALFFLLKEYGVSSVTYFNIIEFINNPKYYNINLSSDRKIDNFINNM